MTKQGFPFPIPPEVMEEVRKDRFLFISPPWERYTAPQGEFWNVEECCHKGDLAPWMLATVWWWNILNRPLIDLLKEHARLSGDQTLESLMFHVIQAFDSLECIIETAQKTWRHDPVYEFVKQPDEDDPEGEGSEEKENETASETDEVVAMK